MACRLCNRSSQPLRIDLRGGRTLVLAPGATSAALLEEQLYDNMFLPRWEREGLVVRLPARFSEVTEVSEIPQPAPAPRRAARKPAASAKSAKKKDKGK
jgi:hypothetical protein